MKMLTLDLNRWQTDRWYCIPGQLLLTLFMYSSNDLKSNTLEKRFMSWSKLVGLRVFQDRGMLPSLPKLKENKHEIHWISYPLHPGLWFWFTNSFQRRHASGSKKSSQNRRRWSKAGLMISIEQFMIIVFPSLSSVTDGSRVKWIMHGLMYVHSLWSICLKGVRRFAFNLALSCSNLAHSKSFSSCSLKGKTKRKRKYFLHFATKLGLLANLILEKLFSWATHFLGLQNSVHLTNDHVAQPTPTPFEQLGSSFIPGDVIPDGAVNEPTLNGKCVLWTSWSLEWIIAQKTTYKPIFKLDIHFSQIIKIRSNGKKEVIRDQHW